MKMLPRTVDSGRRHASLAELVRNISYEIMPLRNTEQAVLADVPTTVPLTVTVTAARGLDATLDLTERLVRHGYRVAPHLAARQLADRRDLARVVDRLATAGVRSVFVVGGDVARPVGEFPDAYSLLLAMQALDHPFEEVGIGGYPEGHADIPPEAIDLALKRKAPMATRVVTQICFDARTTSAWATRIAGCGIGLPVHVGMPGPVNRQKLIRISAGLGLGQSARYLRKQQSAWWRFLLPRGYHPTRLVSRLGGAGAGVGNNIRGLHIFTFNEVRGTELWRRALLSSVATPDGRA